MSARKVIRRGRRSKEQAESSFWPIVLAILTIVGALFLGLRGLFQ